MVALLITARFVGPAYVLLTPAPFFYPLLIVLSTLRLDFRLCLFTGAVSAVQYWTLSMIFLMQAERQSLGESSTEAIPMGNVHVQGRENGIGIFQLA